jgi:biopolymer transport protein ExbD
MEEKSFDSMNVIPLVDVMMVLLTIVLMTSTFVASGVIPVQLPKAGHKQSAVLKAVTVSIDKKGALYYEALPVTLRGLQEKLASLGQDTPIQVRADRTIALQDCVDVLDLLSANNFKKVSLQTEKGP